MQAKAAEDLKRLFGEALQTRNLTYTHSEAHVTPRRLALMVDGLPLCQPDMVEERKGPKLGSPEGAIQGFLKGAGLASLEEAEQRDTGKGIFWYATTRRPGSPVEDVLEEIVIDVISKFPWPKSMRWSAHRLVWVRPLHNIMMVLDGKPIVAKIEIGPTLSYTVGNTTAGHRFLAPEWFEVKISLITRRSCASILSCWTARSARRKSPASFLLPPKPRGWNWSPILACWRK